jgi:predicted acyltransferase
MALEEKMVEPVSGKPQGRLMSLDVYRGFVMLAMASEGFGLPQVAQAFPESPVWRLLAYQFEHVEWVGCAAWDLIQPSFMFMVGVSMPFSYASRAARGETFGRMFLHVLYRSFALTALGIFLRSNHDTQTYFTFEDVLTQIGLGYTFLFLLWRRKASVQFLAALLVLAGTWLVFVLHPLPPSGFDYSSVGVPNDWPHPSGLAAHFDKNTNAAAAFDQWFLNLFPRKKPFVYNGGGYLTLSFVPSLATMIFGLIAGGLLRSGRSPGEKFRLLMGAGVLCLAAGQGLDWLGICPVVKRIWTPSWAIFSTGWTCLLIGAFFGVIDWRGLRRWAFPLVVVGMNSIAMYGMAHLIGGWVGRSLKIHLGQQVFQIFGKTYEPIVESASVLFILWLICLWMYRRKIFLRI